MRANAPPDGELEGDVGMVRDPVGLVNERRPRRTAACVLAVAPADKLGLLTRPDFWIAARAAMAAPAEPRDT